MPRQRLIDALTAWTTPTIPRPSPTVLVGRTPAPLKAHQSSNSPDNILVERTPANEYRPSTAPAGPSMIQETPRLRRSYSDSFETPLSVIPDSQLSMPFQHHDNLALEMSSSPFPTHQDERSLKKRKVHEDIEEGMEEIISPDDTSTPLEHHPPQETSSSLPDTQQLSLPPQEGEGTTSASVASQVIQQTHIPPDHSTNLPCTSFTRPYQQEETAITCPSSQTIDVPQTTPAIPSSINPPTSPPGTPTSSSTSQPPAQQPLTITSISTLILLSTYRYRRTVPPGPPPISSSPPVTHQTSRLLALRNTVPRIIASVVPSRPLGMWERGCWQFELTGGEWSRPDREKMWAFLDQFVTGGAGGWGMMAVFEEGDRRGWDLSEVRSERAGVVAAAGAGGEGGNGVADRRSGNGAPASASGSGSGSSVGWVWGEGSGEGDGRVKVFCWGECVREVYVALWLATGRRIKECGARWVDMSGVVVVDMGRDRTTATTLGIEKPVVVVEGKGGEREGLEKRNS
ncbi:MAG: hypothetical protein Q9202_006075 [Teloschistes flavicans]